MAMSHQEMLNFMSTLDIPIDELLGRVRKSDPTVPAIYISSEKMESLGPRGPITLAVSLAASKTLRRLILDANCSYVLFAVAELLKEDRVLQFLKLEVGKRTTWEDAEGQGDLAGMALAEALQENRMLETCDLTIYYGYKSLMGDRAGVALARALEDNDSLKTFALELMSEHGEYGDINGGMGDKTGAALATAIARNCTLESFTLRLCDVLMTDKTGVKLAEALETNCTLRTFNLSLKEDNDFGTHQVYMTGQTGVALAEALKVNKTLTAVELNFEDNDSSDDDDQVASRFTEVLREHNTSLRRLRLRGLVFPNQNSFISVEQALARNRELPNQWVSVASFARYANSQGGVTIPEKDFRWLIFRFFLPSCFRRCIRTKTTAQGASDRGTKARSTMHAVTHHEDDGIRKKAEVPVPLDEAIEHTDLPAIIDEQEAAQFSAVQHAGFIERKLHTVIDEATGYADAGGAFLCKINRNTKELRQEFMKGPALAQCRNALEACGHPWVHESGALIFVHPSQYHAVMGRLPYMLQADHVLFAARLEYLVEEAMSHCKRVWMKDRVEISSGSSEAAIYGVEEMESVCEASENAEQVEWFHVADIIVDRTFIKLIHGDGSESVVTKSSTDAHLPNSMNPRHSKRAL